MHKIGINKCDKPLLHFSKVFKSSTVVIDSNLPPIKNIISFMICPTYEDLSVDDKLECKLKMFFNVNIKIIYSTYKDNGLYVINKIFNFLDHINIPRVIDGIDSTIAFAAKKITPKTYVENTHIKILNERSIIVSYFFINEACITPSYTLAFLLNNINDSFNVFFSYNDGSNLTQKTFTKNIKYKNLLWCPKSDELAFIANFDGNDNIYIISKNSINPIRLIDNIPFANVKNFVFKDSNTILYTLDTGFMTDIYSFNIRNKKNTNLTKSNGIFNASNPLYSKNTGHIYFIKNESTNTILSCMNSFGENITNLLSNFNIIDFTISYNDDYIGIITNNDTVKSLNLFNCKNRTISTLPFEDIFKDITSIKFSPSSYFLAFITKYENKDDIILYNIFSKTFKNITMNDANMFISNFDFDFNGNSIYYFKHASGESSLVKFSLEKFYEESLFSLPCNYGNVSCKHTC